MDSEVVVSAFQDDSLGSDDAVVIAEKIKKGELDAKTVTRDAIRRAELVNPKLNAIAVENFDFAQFDYADVRKYLLKGIWYFDKKSTQLRFRPIALGPVAISPEEKFDSGEEQSTDNTNSSETDDFWGGDEDDENQENEEVTEAEEVEEDEGDSVVEAEAENNDEKEYRAMFWVFFPEVRDILPVSYTHLTLPTILLV